MAHFNLAILPGDGIGPEVIEEAVKVVKEIGSKFGHSYDLNYALVGGVAIEETGESLIYLLSRQVFW